MAKWVETRKGGDFQQMANECGISPVFARILRNRDVFTKEDIHTFLVGDLADLGSPLLLPDVRKAAGLLREAISENKKIRVIGDYDVDGIASTYILVKALRNMGADVSYRLPNRLKDGYGLNENMIEDAVADGVDLVLTCDNGIAAAGPIRKAKEAGLKVIVTDHHEVPYAVKEDGTKECILPPADAIVEPKIRNGEGEYICPFREICGAVVALKLMQVLYREEDPASLFTRGAEDKDHALFMDLLSFAAIATICDVMPLRDENRVLVKEGLKALENTENPGMKALIAVEGLTGQTLTTYHAGFILGPALNASGRLESAERALSLFAESFDERECGLRAQELKDLNDSRKTMTEKGKKSAMEMVHAENYGKDRVLVLYLADAHESIAGIIAGKVREEFSRPVFILTNAQQEGMLKGSGRSIEAYDMYGAMNEVGDVFTQFGGHRMAAGLSIKKERLEEFRSRINENCTLTEEDMTEVLHLDMVLPPRYLSFNLMDELKELEPCGVGNERPLFAARDLWVEELRIFGQNRNVLRLSLRDEEGAKFQGIRFGDTEEMRTRFDEAFGPGTFDGLLIDKTRRGTSWTGSQPVKVHAAYRPKVNEYRGVKEIQLQIEDLMFVR